MGFKLGDFFPRKPINKAMLLLDDPQWKELEGGYRRTLYDASEALTQLEKATTLQQVDDIYKELWDELHHQGDVGLASYYSVPHLVRIAKQTQLIDYNVFGLVSLIEIKRHKNNPELPKALKPAYEQSIMGLESLVQMVLKQDWNLDLATSALAALALTKQQVNLANVIFALDDSLIDEFLENYG